MEPRSAALLSILVLLAPVPSAVSQTGDLSRGDNQGFTIVQETQDHYILAVELPAALFKPDQETRLDLPLDGISIEGGPEDGVYRMRISIDPTQLGEGTMRLEDTLWDLEAQLQDATGETTPLPSTPEVDGTDLGTSIDELVAQVEALRSQVDQLHNEINGTLDMLPDEGVLPPGLTETELATVQAALQIAQDELELAAGFLEDTEAWLQAPADDLTDGLKPADRSLAIAGALLSDAGRQVEQAQDRIPLTSEDLGAGVDQVVQTIERLQRLIDETRDDVRDQAHQVAARADETAGWADRQLGDGGDRIETARETLNQILTGLLGGEEDDPDKGPDDRGPGDDRPGEGPGGPDERKGSGDAEDDGSTQPSYGTLHEHLVALANLTDTGATPETSDQMRGLVDDAIGYTSQSEERLTWTQAWLNRSPVGPFAQAHVDKAQVLLEAASQDGQTLNASLNALLASDEEDTGEDDASLLQDARTQLNATRAQVDEAVGHLANATEAIGDVTDPQGLVEERLEHPTLLRVYLPKDPSQIPQPTLPGGTQDLPADGDNTSDLPGEDLGTGDLLGDDGEDETDGSDDGSEETDEDGDDGSSGVTVQADPDHVAIQEDEQRVIEVTVTNQDDEADTFHLTVQREGPFQIDTNGEASLDLDPGETGNLALRLTPTGPGEGEAALLVTGDRGASSQVDLPVTIDPATEGQGEDAAIWADLDPLNVRMSTDETGVVRVSVRNDGSLRDTVRLATSATGPVRADVRGAASVTLDPEQEQILEVELTPETEGEASVDLQLSSDRGGQLNPVLLVDVLEQAAEDVPDQSDDPAAPGQAPGAGPTAGEDERPDREEERGMPFPGIAAIVAALAVVALLGRRRGR